MQWSSHSRAHPPYLPYPPYQPYPPKYNDPTMPAVCAFCRKQPVDPACRPFCSERCRLQDLARWLDGGYTIPGEPLADDDLESESLERERQK